MSEEKHLEAPEPRVKTHRMSRKAKRRLVIVVAVIIVGMGGGAAAIALSMRPKPLLDRALVKEARFPVYAPTALPNGYSLKKNGQQVTRNVFIYELVSASQQITVTVQPSPDGFDMAKMMEGGSITSTATPVGPMYNLSAGGASKYLLDVGTELVFLTSPTKVDTATINSIANNLARAK